MNSRLIHNYTPENRANYKDVNNETNKIMIKTRKSYLQEKLEETVSNRLNNNIRNFYKSVKYLKKNLNIKYME